MSDSFSAVDAEEAFAAAIAYLGFAAEHPSSASAHGSEHGADLVIEVPGGPTSIVQLKTMSLVNTDAALRLRNQAVHSPTATLHVVVAPRVTAAARDVLNDAGLSWFDLRGHLRLVGPGIFVDTPVAPLSDPTPQRAGILGQVGTELAALMLIQPQKSWGVREAAHALSRAPSSVSQALSALRAAQLVTDQLEPVNSELFWELARHWGSARADVASLPEPEPASRRRRDTEVLHLGLDDVETTTGWALSDTVAAGHYGAPVAIRSNHPPDLYVPDRSTLRRAVTLLGAATSAAQRAGQVRVAPVPAICTQRLDGGSEWPLAHPLFVALDLAQDPGRGQEILNDWTPPGPAQRVW